MPHNSADFASLVTLPAVIDAPGEYLTRAGEHVVLTETTTKHRFGCHGTYPCGTPDHWHKSGRLYFGIECSNDIVSKVTAH